MESLPNIVAAWVGCVGRLLGLVRSAWRCVESRPRIAPPEFCVHDGGPGVWLSNLGKCPVDIECVRFTCVNEWNERRTVILSSDQEGPIPVKRGIDCDQLLPPWQRFYSFLGSKSDELDVTISGSIALFMSDPGTWSLEVWVRGRDKPLWTGQGKELAGMLEMVDKARR